MIIDMLLGVAIAIPVIIAKEYGKDSLSCQVLASILLISTCYGFAYHKVKQHKDTHKCVEINKKETK